MALEGDLEATVAALQKAIACGSYSARDAFHAVVFRAYWTVPGFVDRLKPMLGENTLEIPFLDTCPPHRLELELRQRASQRVAA
jgi:hypothetical protein